MKSAVQMNCSRAKVPRGGACSFGLPSKLGLGSQCATPPLVVRSQPKDAVVLVGDIGGTNARLSAWRVSDGKQVHKKTYSTKQFDEFENCVQEFLEETEIKGNAPKAAVIAAAGEVANNKCIMTNVGWVVDGPRLEADLKVRVAVLNDFEAVGYGIPALPANDIDVINDVPVVPKAPKVVMGPGTGLGAAQLMWDSGTHSFTVWPGEGSHATFAPRGWKQQALANYVTNLHGHCEIEQVACGSGLELIYSFLLTDEVANRPELLTPAGPKKAAEISAAALAGDPLAVEAVDMFFAIVGAEAGAMALRCLAKGGVYIAGGITPKLLSRAKAGALMEGFLNSKGRQRFREILQGMPLFVIKNESVGQIGAFEYAKRLVSK